MPMLSASVTRAPRFTAVRRVGLRIPANADLPYDAAEIVAALLRPVT